MRYFVFLSNGMKLEIDEEEKKRLESELYNIYNNNGFKFIFIDGGFINIKHIVLVTPDKVFNLVEEYKKTADPEDLAKILELRGEDKQRADDLMVELK